MATSRHRQLVSFTSDELVQVRHLADQLQLSVSELLRRLVLGHRLPDSRVFEASQAIRDLLKVNADQARLGNLMLMAVDAGEGQFTPRMIADIEDLVMKARATQTQIKEMVAAIHRQAHPKSSLGR